MQAKGIGTPALTALLLKDLLTKKSNELITFAEKQTTNKLFVRLTHYGSSQVEIWRKHDMLGNSVAYGTVSRKVADAQINIEDALLALGLEPETLNKASTYIKNQGIGWENLKTLSV